MDSGTVSHPTLAIDAHDPARVAGFWAGLLGREVVDDGRGLLLPGPDTQVGLRFVQSDSAKVGPGRVHLHVTSTSSADQEATVAAVLVCRCSVGRCSRSSVNARPRRWFQSHVA